MQKDLKVREQMFSLIASWQQSGLSQKAFCQQNNLGYHVFHYWYRVYREEHPAPVNDSSFVRLAMKADKDVPCEVVFTDGTKILFREPVSVQYLKSLLF